jgi:hypothetical protein
MSEQVVTPGMNEDEVLAYTQNLRVRIIKEVTKGGVVPDDRSAQSLLMNQLDSLERTALTSKRIKADEAAAETGAGAAALIAKLLSQAGSGRREETDIIEARVVPVLGSDVPEPVLVPGETEIAPGQLDYDSFMAKHAPLQSSGHSSSSDGAGG